MDIVAVGADIVAWAGRVSPGTAAVFALVDLGIGAVGALPGDDGIAVVVHGNMGIDAGEDVVGYVIRMVPGAAAVFAFEDPVGTVALFPGDDGVAAVVHGHLGIGGIVVVGADIVGYVVRMVPGAAAVFAFEDLVFGGGVVLIPGDDGVAVVVHGHLGMGCTVVVGADVVGDGTRVGPAAVSVFALEDLGVGAVVLTPGDDGVAV